jgi:RNA polymerase sigma factor (sigma-70 family)
MVGSRPPHGSGGDPIALVERIANGDSIAEEELVRFYQGDVFRMLRGRTRDPEGARELADDVLMAVVCALRDGKLRDATKLRAFVHGTMRNVANNYFRNRLSRPREEPLDPDTTPAVHADGLEERERLTLLRRGLASLSAADRQILLLTMLEDIKPAQIAQRLGLTPEIVRARKSRALHRLIARTRGSDA